MLSIPHMIVVFLVVLVVFGPQKLPELARSFGKLMAEFRKASGDFKNAFEEEIRDLERQARIAELKKQAAEAVAAATASVTAEGGTGVAPVVATMGSPEGTDAPSNPYPLEQVTESPVIEPVAEAVPRLDAGVVESVSAVEPEIAVEAKQSELNFIDQKPKRETAGANAAAESDPSHDQQQPA
jgi:TatA/E family protein of Tat protein translocase